MIEFIRVNERVAGPLTVVHLAALAAVVAGAAFVGPFDGHGACFIEIGDARPAS
jgi:hypothetical protein